MMGQPEPIVSKGRTTEEELHALLTSTPAEKLAEAGRLAQLAQEKSAEAGRLRELGERTPAESGDLIRRAEAMAAEAESLAVEAAHKKKAAELASEFEQLSARQQALREGDV